MQGPVCPDVLSPVSRFSTIWGTPVFTTSGMSSAFRDKSSEYKYLTCMAGDYRQLGHFVNQLLGTELSQIKSDHYNPCVLFTDQHGWQHVSLLYDEQSASCSSSLHQVWTMRGGRTNTRTSIYPLHPRSSRCLAVNEYSPEVQTGWFNILV